MKKPTQKQLADMKRDHLVDVEAIHGELEIRLTGVRIREHNTKRLVLLTSDGHRQDVLLEDLTRLEIHQ